MNTHWTAQWFAAHAPLQPAGWLAQAWLTLAWGVVTVWLVGAVVNSWRPRSPRMQGVVVALGMGWAVLPGAYSSTHWLALAFQSPSVVTVFLCLLVGLKRAGLYASARQPEASTLRVDSVLAVAGVVVGWLLLLDTFALLPVFVFDWGWTPLALAVVVLAGMLPWVVQGSTGSRMGWVLVCAAGVFAVTGLPGSNLWDAILDPWLWLYLHAWLALQGVRRRQI